MNANRSGIIALADAIRMFFATLSAPQTSPIVVGRVGKSQRSRWDNQAPAGAGRVLLMTNDPDGGELVRGRLATGNPRVAFEWNQAITLSIWAADPTATQNEEAQIEATEALFELVLEAIETAVDPMTGIAIGAGHFITPMRVKRVATENQLMYFGLEIQISLTVKTLLYQRPIPVVVATSAPTALIEHGPVTGSSAAE